MSRRAPMSWKAILLAVLAGFLYAWAAHFAVSQAMGVAPPDWIAELIRDHRAWGESLWEILGYGPWYLLAALVPAAAVQLAIRRQPWLIGAWIAFLPAFNMVWHGFELGPQARTAIAGAPWILINPLLMILAPMLVAALTQFALTQALRLRR